MIIATTNIVKTWANYSNVNSVRLSITLKAEIVKARLYHNEELNLLNYLLRGKKYPLVPEESRNSSY